LLGDPTFVDSVEGVRTFTVSSVRGPDRLGCLGLAAKRADHGCDTRELWREVGDGMKG
jgi:hypothetical protein